MIFVHWAHTHKTKNQIEYVHGFKVNVECSEPLQTPIPTDDRPFEPTCSRICMPSSHHFNLSAHQQRHLRGKPMQAYDWCEWCTWYWYETTFMNLIASISDKKSHTLRDSDVCIEPSSFGWMLFKSWIYKIPSKMQISETNWRLSARIAFNNSEYYSIRMLDEGSSSWKNSFDIPKMVEGLTKKKWRTDSTRLRGFDSDNHSKPVALCVWNMDVPNWCFSNTKSHLCSTRQKLFKAKTIKRTQTKLLWMHLMWANWKKRQSKKTAPKECEKKERDKKNCETKVTLENEEGIWRYFFLKWGWFHLVYRPWRSS